MTQGLQPLLWYNLINRKVKTVAISDLEVMPMTVYQVIANPKERLSVVSIHDTLELMFEFGSFLIALLGLILVMIKTSNHKK